MEKRKGKGMAGKSQNIDVLIPQAIYNLSGEFRLNLATKSLSHCQFPTSKMRWLIRSSPNTGPKSNGVTLHDV